MSLILDKINKNSQAVSDGKFAILDAIYAKGGTVDIFASTPSFESLVNGINSIVNVNGSTEATILAESDILKGDVCSLREAPSGFTTSEAYTLSGVTSTSTPLIFKHIAIIDESDGDTVSYGVSGTSYATTNLHKQARLSSTAYDEVNKLYFTYKTTGNYLFTLQDNGKAVTPFTSMTEPYATPGIFAHKNNFTGDPRKTNTTNDTHFYKWNGSSFTDNGKIIGNTGLAQGTSYLIDYILDPDDTLYTCTLYNDTSAIIQKIPLNSSGNYIGTSNYIKIDNILTTGIDLFDYNISLGDVYSNILFGKDANFIMWLDTNKKLHFADFDKTNLSITEKEINITNGTINRFVLAGDVLYLDLTIDGTNVVEAYVYDSGAGKFKLWCKPSDVFSPAVNAGQMVYPIRERDGSKITMLNSNGGYTTYNLTKIETDYDYYANNCSNTISTDKTVSAYGVAKDNLTTGDIGNALVILNS